MPRQTLSDYAIGYDSACLITTKGGSIKQKRLVNDVIFWTLSKLLSKKLTDNIYIEIVLQKRFYKDYGCVMWEDNNINPRDFVMELNTGISDRQLVSTTIHETMTKHEELVLLIGFKGHVVLRDDKSAYPPPWSS